MDYKRVLEHKGMEELRCSAGATSGVGAEAHRNDDGRTGTA